MRRFRLQSRHLILLALFQLVAGPLVLMQVSLFCTLTVRETPKHGVAVAITKAWHNEQFQALLHVSDEMRVGGGRSDAPKANTKAKVGKMSLSMALGMLVPPVPVAPEKLEVRGGHAETWTPAWPHAPPGPPPRIG